jgi:hypothetical protein
MRLKALRIGDREVMPTVLTRDEGVRFREIYKRIALLLIGIGGTAESDGAEFLSLGLGIGEILLASLRRSDPSVTVEELEQLAGTDPKKYAELTVALLEMSLEPAERMN